MPEAQIEALRSAYAGMASGDWEAVSAEVPPAGVEGGAEGAGA